MDIGFNLLNNSFFTTLLGALVGGFITFKFNYYHEKRKLIMGEKLKVWEIISKYFEEIFIICEEIESRYLESSYTENNKAISVFKSKVIKIHDNINNIDSKLKNYYILFENGNYLYRLKIELFNLWNQVEVTEGDLDIVKFQELFREFHFELTNVHEILNVELVKILDDKKTKRKRIKNFRRERKLK